MSQLRENLNPGLEGDQQRPHHLLHVHHQHQVDGDSNTGGTGGAAAALSIRVDPPSEDDDEDGMCIRVSAGHDSDPPIENENPDEGDECFNEESFIKSPSYATASLERKKELETAARKRAQAHHRKRKKSTHNGDGTYVPPYKKNRAFFFRRQSSVLPSKFLLGGNIRDPLNLASLSDARISAELNRVTPQSSPLPVQGEVPVFIPKNPHDPLGLTTRTPENPGDMIAGVRRNTNTVIINNNKPRKHRHRKRPGRKRTESECSVGTEMTEGDDDENQDSTSRTRRISDVSNEDESAGKHVATQSGQRKRSLSEPSVGQGVVEAIVPPADGTLKLKIKMGKPAPPSVVKPVVIESKTVKQTAPTSSSQASVTSQDSKPSTSKAVNKQNQKSAESARKEMEIRANKSTERIESNYTPLTVEADGRSQDRNYSSGSSEHYRPSSTYICSPFAFDSDYYPSYSPTFSNYAYTPSYEPFSPPASPQMPHFQRRMQMFAARPPRPQQLSLQRAVFQPPFSRRRIRQRGDPIVSPVIPQPGSRRRAHHHHNNNKKPGEKLSTSGTQAVGQAPGGKDADNASSTTEGKSEDVVDGGKKEKKYRPKDQVFQFGNYNQYYGYRTPDQSDPRLWVLKKSYFEEKNVLDIGCNTGHVTLSIARDFEPRRVHGIDIDFSLIAVARKNIKHYMIQDPQDKNVIFPRSLPMIYGAMQPPPALGEKTPSKFPYNVSFAHENYVLASDALLENVAPEHDVIMCLSVTKWIHLNFGDNGMKRFFKRIFLNLRSGGMLILEPQPWSSYTKKKKLTEKIHQTYKSIRFFPDHFEDYLLKEVGFVSVEQLGTPVHNSKGFQRPLLLFTKAESSEALSAPRSPWTVPVTAAAASSTSSCIVPVVVASTSTNKSSTATCTVTSCSPLSSEECTSTMVSSNSNKVVSASASEDQVGSSCSTTTSTTMPISSVSVNVPTSSSESEERIIPTVQDVNEYEVSSAQQPDDNDDHDGAYHENETDDGVTSSSDPR